MTEKVAGKLYESITSFSGSWAVWKTIQCGIEMKTSDEFRRALEGGGFLISDWANDVMRKPGFTVSSEKVELDLVIVTVAELGFPKGVTRKKFYERAQSLGLELCPLEAGPRLRLQYRDQPADEWLLMAMEPIKDSADDPCVFCFERLDDGIWLHLNYVFSGFVWPPDSRWVFALRK